jgi:hypothetical protein
LKQGHLDTCRYSWLIISTSYNFANSGQKYSCGQVHEE